MIYSFMELLAYTCKDKRYSKYDYNNIDYFIWETDYGTKADKYYITEADGTEIHFYTPEDVWNYLVKLHPEIEDKEEWDSEVNSNDMELDGQLSFDDLKKIFEV